MKYPLFLILALIPAPSFAQYNYPDMMAMNLDFGNLALEQNRTNAMLDSDDNEPAPNSINSSGGNQTVAPANLNYSPSMSERKKNYANYVAQLRKLDPTSANQAQQVLASTDIIRQLDGVMRPMGLRSTNVADAFSLWWVIAWHAANGRQGQPDRNIMAAVKQQAESALASTPQMRGASNAVKQEMAESMLIHAALIDAGIDDAAGNPTKTAALAKAVNQGAKKIGLDLTKFTLTPNGFVPRSRGRSDAGDAAGADSQLAANDDGAQADSTSMGDYALYAVAGTGLLAGMFALGKGFSKKG